MNGTVLHYLFGARFVVLLPPTPKPPADDAAWRARAEAWIGTLARLRPVQPPAGAA